MNSILNFIRKLIPHPVFEFFQPAYHYLLAFLAAIVYGFPSRKIKVIGVTGTKGKSSTVYFLSRILEDSGRKTAAISTIEFKISDKTWPNKLKMTMPGRFQLQSFLKKAVKAGCKFAVLEVSSQGVEQFRHKFINFDAAVFTNLAPEHIDAHGSFENYKKAKLKFFQYVKNNHIINGDDKYFEDFYATVAQNKKAYSLDDFKDLKLQLVGDFNLSNAAAAIKTAEIYGVPYEKSKAILESIKNIRGRMEFIKEGQNFDIIVDYAHTPDSLEKVYQALSGKNLICVLGNAGGGRDAWKRKVMGEIADRHCREIILTDEDPYDENPLKIVEQMKEGIKNKPCRTIMDRREAIREAIVLAKTMGESSAVIVTGKGTDPYIMGPKGTKTQWDDAMVAREELKNI